MKQPRPDPLSLEPFKDPWAAINGVCLAGRHRKNRGLCCQNPIVLVFEPHNGLCRILGAETRMEFEIKMLRKEVRENVMPKVDWQHLRARVFQQISRLMQVCPMQCKVISSQVLYLSIRENHLNYCARPACLEYAWKTHARGGRSLREAATALACRLA